jgi:hypothetical protein
LLPLPSNSYQKVIFLLFFFYRLLSLFLKKKNFKGSEIKIFGFQVSIFFFFVDTIPYIYFFLLLFWLINTRRSSQCMTSMSFSSSKITIFSYFFYNIVYVYMNVHVGIFT